MGGKNSTGKLNPQHTSSPNGPRSSLPEKGVVYQPCWGTAGEKEVFVRQVNDSSSSCRAVVLASSHSLVLPALREEATRKGWALALLKV